MYEFCWSLIFVWQICIVCLFVMMLVRFLFLILVLVAVVVVDAKTHRILLDTDVDTDDFFAILYLLKQNRSVIDLKAITVSANEWTDAGHAVNQVYDLLYMMGRDDIAVGVGGDGGILDNGTILTNVGGYLPLIEQGMSTAGNCRYRQAIPVGSGGRLDINTNYGIRRSFLPQGPRKYSPLHQPTTQRVMTDTISAGPTTVFIIGSHTNFALFLMTNPHLKKNVERIYVMGGGVRARNPTGCCPKHSKSRCTRQQCGDRGNIFTSFHSNPYAEFNIFGDPFAAYQVFHSGIPITLVPLDATNTIPVNKKFFMAFEQNQSTYEAQYCFQSLKFTRDTWIGDQFYTSFFMWDSFTSGVAVSTMLNAHNKNGENEFAEMHYLNITVVTSNKPYGAHDGSNPFFDGRDIPKFNLQKKGVHSGHVQTGVEDPFCIVKGQDKGICQDGYTKEITGPEAVRVLVARKAKPNRDAQSPLDREYFINFLSDLNLPQQSGRFNFTTEFPYYREVFYKPTFSDRKLGKPVIFDMDMSAGDFLTLIYLLKVPVELINLKGILVSGNGWANAATIDIIYDVLHMMGRDDIPVGLGNLTAQGTSPLSCTYVKAIPHGSGGFIDSDTLYGLGRTLPRSPRQYTADNSVEHGAPRDTEHPERRQALAFEVWQSVTKAVYPKDKITILTNGPLTNLANILLYDKNANSVIQEVFIVGGHIHKDKKQKGNIFTIPSNKHAEFNMFLDPLAAKTVLESDLKITLIPLNAQCKVTSFPTMLNKLELVYKTPEAEFAHQLLSLLHNLQQKNKLYHHMDIFLGEILGAVVMVQQDKLNPKLKVQRISVSVGNIARDGKLVINKKHGKLVNILDSVDSEAYYEQFTDLLGAKTQSAVIGSFDEQKSSWSQPPNSTKAQREHRKFLR